jgi:hypothetical protein
MPIAYLPYSRDPGSRQEAQDRLPHTQLPALPTTSALVFPFYYWAISPYMDATFTGTGYTNQGFLGEVEFRQNFANGEHILRMAGISQANPGDFTAGTSDSDCDRTWHDCLARGSSGSIRAGPSAGTGCCSPTTISRAPTGFPGTRRTRSNPKST